MPQHPSHTLSITSPNLISLFLEVFFSHFFLLTLHIYKFTEFFVQVIIRFEYNTTTIIITNIAYCQLEKWVILIRINNF